jgi:hypothetical protein
MIKTIAFAALCAFASTSFAAAPASCFDRSGKALPPEKCVETARPVSRAPATGSAFAGRKAMVLKHMRHAEGVIKKTIACAEKARNDEALRACAE